MSIITTVGRLVPLALLRLHGTVHRKINGRIGHQMPRKTRQLLGNVVASSGVSDKHPGGYHTGRKRMECEINLVSKRYVVNARRITTDGVHHARLWEIVNKNNANRYTVVRVERRGPSRSSH